MNPTIIRGQKVDRTKLQRAKELRQTMTPAEKSLWEKLRANRLGGFHFCRQQKRHGAVKKFRDQGYLWEAPFSFLLLFGLEPRKERTLKRLKAAIGVLKN